MDDDTRPGPVEPEPWTDEARERFANTPQELIEALVEHRRVALGMVGDDDRDELRETGQEVVSAAIMCCYDQETFTDELSPLWPVAWHWQRWDEDEDDDDVELPATEDVTHVSVLYRRDYEVEDLERLRTAARAALWEHQPDVEERLGAEQVELNLGSIGTMLYHLAHGRGVGRPRRPGDLGTRTAGWSDPLSRHLGRASRRGGHGRPRSLRGRRRRALHRAMGRASPRSLMLPFLRLM